MMKYISTRGGGEPQTFEDVLLAGLAPDGGLYVPETWPSLDLAALKGKSYVEIAQAVIAPFVEGCIDTNTLRNILKETYGPDHFRSAEVVPLHQLSEKLYVMEQFHGPTIAFKDVALQLLGRLFDHILKKRGTHVTIVGATSGDTGSAAIEGCKHADNVEVFILFPDGRVSEVQRRQMTTVDSPNVHNIALQGTFDDCQDMVKAMFADKDFREEMNLSAVNSINWARIMAQIVYYVSTALKLGAPEQEVTFVVPTGNFGNVFAGYVARQMGVPIRLAIATNKNDILTRFFETGEMTKTGVEPTLSPSMDIQVSSNFERFLFDLLDRDAEKLATLMRDFKATGSLILPMDVLERAQGEFRAFRLDDTGTLGMIKRVYDETGYILDPHTAVGMQGGYELAEQESGSVVVLGTAHPAKFPDAVEKAIGVRPPLPDHLFDLFDREEHFTTQPNDLKSVQDFVRAQKS